MDNRAFDKFVTDILNTIKDEAKDSKDLILRGNLDLETYRYQAGIMYGLDRAATLFVEGAEKTFNELYGETV